MIRAFVAVAVPDPVAERLAAVQAGLPAGRPVAPEGMHLTLAFLGEQPEPVLEDLHLAFGRIRGALPPLAFEGLGTFGGTPPRSLHAAIRPDPALKALRGRVQQAVREAGIDLPRERFVPHVTLARFRQRMGEEDLARLHQFLATRMGALPAEMVPERFALYRSVLTRDGAVYDSLADYPLG